MKKYKLINHIDYLIDNTKEPNCVFLIEKNMIIPFDPANCDFQQFKLDLADGVELQDADGNTMTAEEVAEFVATLP